ncbi:hypothetical protein Agabi119p4_5398 [Agaricus bisporus var. burnettii]|uniref:Uncharacterized protein n=1 Tax=Agaricus bisporus var. burnettii TaxID=192524 RepID=A0A8H7KGF7_AGABI|nr:hypothetical protein Agabi119p4_5398 [Agaricus bisporus var. burnettii]
MNLRRRDNRTDFQLSSTLFPHIRAILGSGGQSAGAYFTPAPCLATLYSSFPSASIVGVTGECSTCLINQAVQKRIYGTDNRELHILGIVCLTEMMEEGAWGECRGLES